MSEAYVTDEKRLHGANSHPNKHKISVNIELKFALKGHWEVKLFKEGERSCVKTLTMVIESTETL